MFVKAPPDPDVRRPNWTEETPEPPVSAAVAESVSVPLTAWPAATPPIVTVGLVLSTSTFVAVLARGFPATSVASARIS